MSRPQRTLTPVPAGYNGITDECIRENATSRIIWHGRDAEARAMEQAKEYVASGQTIGAQNSLRMVREIRRQLEGWEGPKLLAQHYECARQIAEGEAREAAKLRERQEREAAYQPARPAQPSDADAIEGPKIYTLLSIEDETCEQAAALAGVSPTPDDTVIVIRLFGPGAAEPERRLLSIAPKGPKYD